MPEPLVVGLLGAGVVGGGVVELLRRHAAAYERRVGRPVRLGPVAVRDTAKARDFATDGLAISADWRRVVEDPEVHVVVEVMGGLDPAVPALVQVRTCASMARWQVARCA